MPKQTRHTPGPEHSPGSWRWEFSGTMGRWRLMSPDGPVDVGGPPDAPLSPDMRLLAAAPDLLAACRNLLAVVRLQNGNLHDDTNAIQALARAAIAKARGLDDERIAALVDGRLSGAERDDVLSRLAEGGEDYRVFTDAADAQHEADGERSP